jgi:peptidoglycan-N-acetylglucosamine deacetylase
VHSGAISLTFDDGPDELWTVRVLAELRRLDIRATFFLMGERVQATPWLARAIAQDGHEIGLHCHRHIRHIDLGEPEIEADTLAALATFADIGITPTRWRTPWGMQTPASVRVAERHGLNLVHWTIDTHDWRGDTSEEMLVRVKEGLEDGAIVLMHDALGPGATRTGCEQTLALLEPLHATAQAHCVRLVSVAELTAHRVSSEAEKVMSTDAATVEISR